MSYSSTPITKNNKKSQHAKIKKLLSNMPVQSVRLKINQYEKQLTTPHAIIHHSKTRQLLTSKNLQSLEEKKHFVIKRVAQKLWENFCLYGNDSPMLRHLYSVIRTEHGKDLQFRYPTKNMKILILEKKENRMVSVSHNVHVSMVNKAWHVSQEVVSSYIN